ncbi:hypothetical protein [uncultured Alcanivorax sp.]|jgi:hypothetical protein|uniref:hypothetical protein n=1 Tax=uncultured Alcanivorax sp. TaxID=191215 RepID=UPI0030DD5D1C
MIVRLFCPKCALEASKEIKGSLDIEVPVPVSQLADDGRYEVRCGIGHECTVILDNIKFELLFEMGLNAMFDGYPREAVSSFTSSLERFYEFYWRVAMHHAGVPTAELDQAWKPMSKMSERQLGAFITASMVLAGSKPRLLNPNKQVPFRNSVIHNGYVPTKAEAIEFGNTVMELIFEGLDQLRELDSSSLMETYQIMSPRDYEEGENSEDSDELVGCVNILTAIDVRNPPKGDDQRVGDVGAQIKRIGYERQPMKMQLLTEQEMHRHHPDRVRVQDDE